MNKRDEARKFDQEEKYIECLADKECFAKSLETCSKTYFSQCGLGMCNEASIEGEQNGKCIIRNWQSQNDKVVNYDVKCLVPKWSFDLESFEAEFMSEPKEGASDAAKGIYAMIQQLSEEDKRKTIEKALETKKELLLKELSPTNICEH